MFPESFIDDDFNFYSEIIIIKERMEGRNFDFRHFSSKWKEYISGRKINSCDNCASSKIFVTNFWARIKRKKIIINGIKQEKSYKNYII